jgi:hypothetical protein
VSRWLYMIDLLFPSETGRIEFIWLTIPLYVNRSAKLPWTWPRHTWPTRFPPKCVRAFLGREEQMSMNHAHTC